MESDHLQSQGQRARGITSGYLSTHCGPQPAGSSNPKGPASQTPACQFRRDAKVNSCERETVNLTLPHSPACSINPSFTTILTTCGSLVKRPAAAVLLCGPFKPPTLPCLTLTVSCTPFPSTEAK